MYTLSVLIFCIILTLLLIYVAYYIDIFIDKLMKKYFQRELDKGSLLCYSDIIKLIRSEYNVLSKLSQTYFIKS